MTPRILIYLTAASLAAQTAPDWQKLGLQYPARGFVSEAPAKTWEHSLVVGNGRMGALIAGEPARERIIFSHEGLFLPVGGPPGYPPMARHLDEIRRLTMKGSGREAAELMVRVGKENGFPGILTTNPLVPACLLEIETAGAENPGAYARSVNWETGEALVAWEAGGMHERRMFISRPDNVAVLRIRAPKGGKLNLRLRLAQLPPGERDRELVQRTIKNVRAGAAGEWLTFQTEFNTPWPGGLGGYVAATRLVPRAGTLAARDGWIEVDGAEELLALTRVQLLRPFDAGALAALKAGLENVKPVYAGLLAPHAAAHGALFRRAALRLGDESERRLTSEQLKARSKVGQTNRTLVERLFDAARYNVISSTGTLPPTLQGIWGGTWRPAWSSDFTQDGNVQAVVAGSLSANYAETMRAYLDYMTGLQADFRENAKQLYGMRGIWVPSRTSDHGRIIHYNSGFPGLYWNAGAAWVAQLYYDYWLYTGDRAFLKQQALPFMLDAAAFYEDFLKPETGEGKLVFAPSYSPEIEPLGMKTNVVPNATMDVAAVKQLLRTLIALGRETGVGSERVERWKTLLAKLPAYEVDTKGSFKEWLWPGLENNDTHRHASHLYPLYFGVDPEIAANPQLQRAAGTAIENRLKYRRPRNGAEMAFGLVQLGQAAANLRDARHAYEAVEWLSNSYWTTALGSFHDPGRIFNTDISGGMPGVIADMLLQSTADGTLTLLPVLPAEWPDGAVQGLRARGGFEVDLEWKGGRLTQAAIRSLLGSSCTVVYGGRQVKLNTKPGGRYELGRKLGG